MTVDPDAPLTAYRPTPTQVAQLLRARTKDANGTEVGDWTADTRPTPEEVDALIDQTEGPILAILGPLDADDFVNLRPAALHLVALGTACVIEKSYFPEQVTSARSAYAEYKAEYDDLLERLAGSVDGGGEGVLPGAGAGHATFWTPAVMGRWGYGGSWWPEPENPANWPDPFMPPTSPVGDEPASGWPYAARSPDVLRVGAPWPLPASLSKVARRSPES